MNSDNKRKSYISGISSSRKTTYYPKMSTLNDEILKGNTPPPEGYLNNYVIYRTSEAVETRLKAIGWDGIQPKASVITHLK